MSKGLGGAVLVVGVGLLAFWARADHADNIETTIAAASADIAQAAIHPVTVDVSGRDITLTGLADSAAERDRLLALADQVDGRRVVRSALDILPTAAPYLTSFTKAPDGGYSADGTLPDDAIRADLVALLPDAGIGDLPLASGAPDGYGAAMTGALAQLGQLDHGELILTDAALGVSGVAPDGDTRTAVMNALGALPGEMTVTADIRVIPLADPFVIDVTKTADGGISATGVTPSADAAARLDDQSGSSTFATLDIARGAPLGWDMAAQTGLSALSMLTTGQLRLENQTLRIRGTAPDDASLADITAALDDIAGFTVINEVTVVPSIVPSDMRVRFDRTRGLFVNGTSPSGLTAQRIATALGAYSVTGALDDSGTDPDTAVTESLATVTAFLPEFETMVLTVNGNEQQLTGELLTESDLDQVSAAMTAPGVFTDVQITRTAARYNDGDQRPNPLTGMTEVYEGGFWLPQVDIADATVQVCDDRTRAVLQGEPVNFLTGSAQLDVTSRATIAELAAYARACLDENDALQLQIEGHTDSVGAADANLRLSAARAETVRGALVARGVAADRLSTRGWGAERPVADNDTAAGRAANRRTVLVWNAQ